MSTRIALVGRSAARVRDLLATLTGAGFESREFADAHALESSVSKWDAVVLLAPEREGLSQEEQAAARQLAASIPLVVVAARIDMEIVRGAANVGAHDVVLLSEPALLIESLRRVLSEGTREPSADLSSEARDELSARLLDLTPTYVSVRDITGRYVLVSQSYADLHGRTVDEMVGKSIGAFAQNPMQAQTELAEDAEVLRTRRSSFYMRELSDSAGTQRLLQTVKRPIVLDDERPFVMTVAVDITSGQRAESTLEKTNEFLKNVLETISDGVFALDRSGKFTLANQRLSQMTGYKHHQLIGMPFTRIFAADSLMDVHRILQGAEIDDLHERRLEAHLARADGLQRVITCSLQPLRQGERVVGIVGTALDVTDRKAAEQRIEHLAYHDPLTNLPNRRLLGDRLTMAMSAAERDGRMVAVLFVDLDRFKSINDSLGHRTGDLVLQELGIRLRASLRAGDTVARMGGDEFLFLLPAIERVEDAIAFARSVLDAIRRPFKIEGREFVLTACIGMSLYPAHAQDAETLIKHADTALFECKRHAVDSYEIFDESMSARSLHFFLMENELRRAIWQNELVLTYQPIVEMRTERVRALEALVRWNHPEKGWLMPDDFIGLAEETGLIIPLGDWVLREACRQNREWQRQGYFMVPVAVNVSARQLESDLVASVSDALLSSGLPAQYLDLELTETLLMESAASSSTTIGALKDLGTHISIDDFGTGYSCLSYLERYPIDALKIDRSFMPNEPQTAGAGVIAATIISMAQSLGIHVVAEGVETREQRDFLLARGCNRAQGHYYFEALKAAELVALCGGDARDGILA